MRQLEMASAVQFYGTPIGTAFYSQRPFWARQSRKIKCVVRSLRIEPTDDRIKRRDVFVNVGLAFLAVQCDIARAEKVPQGYKVCLDKNDGYVFYYPFGWQEVVVKGQDIVYKDVIEPLESVSVNILKTDKKDVHELGPPEKLSKVLVEKFLTSSSQQPELLEVKERETDGQPYYTFEFLAKDPNYTRHAIGAVTVGNGKFYALITGANERRWGKMQEKLHGVVDSFKLLK